MSKRLDKNRPFAAAKKSILDNIKLNSVTDANKPAKDQFNLRGEPFTDIMTNKNVTAGRVAKTVGSRYPWQARKTSYSKSTHKQSKNRR